MAAGLDASAWALKCDGATYNVADYPALAAKLGATYGGDGESTFAVPDYRGRFIRGLDEGAGRDEAGAGRAAGSYQGCEVQSHGHGVSDPGHNHHVNDPGHAHSVQTRAAVTTATSTVGSGQTGAVTANPGTNAAGTGIWLNGSGTGISIQATGGGETRPHNAAETMWIEF